MSDKPEVVVSATHPVLGKLYWYYSWGGDTNSPDYHGLCRHSRWALSLPADWRQDDYLGWLHGRHLRKSFDENDEYGDYAEEFDEETGGVDAVLSGQMEELQLKSGQSVDDFVHWVFNAKWEDEPYTGPREEEDDIDWP